MTKDHLIMRLSTLCKRYSDDPLKGRYEVAKRSGLAEQYLYQVLAEKPMANGNPRSIGKVARDKITRAFPDWLDTPPDATPKNQANQPSSTYGVIVPKPREKVQLVCAMAETLSDSGLDLVIQHMGLLTKIYPITHPDAGTAKAA